MVGERKAQRNCFLSHNRGAKEREQCAGLEKDLRCGIVVVDGVVAKVCKVLRRVELCFGNKSSFRRELP